MRFFLASALLFAGFVPLVGCSTDSTGVPGEPVATSEDEFAAYDKMMMEQEAESAAEDIE